MTSQNEDRVINFVTSNKNKVKEFQQIAGSLFKIAHVDIDYPELRNDDPIEIAKQAAKSLAEELGKPVVVDDSGLFIEALGGFPGTCSAYVHKRIGLTGILKLMEGVSNRNCFYQSAVGYCEPGKEPVAFVGEEKGMIADSVRGSHGFGHDPIFIPEGSSSTYGEMANFKELKQFRRKALKQLLEYLK